jgi:pimeloyl-ACP methyl ester carboxylesterase
MDRSLLAAGLVILSAMLSAAAAVPAFDPALLKLHLIDVGHGRRLNAQCTGEGAPLVVFMQGGEGSMLNWQKVERPIAAITRVCFYDRAGFGYSDPPRGSVTGLSETNDLHALLRKIGARLPVVLVGHSIGGFYATLYADRFPADVAGMVLVDPGFADQYRPRTEHQRELDLTNDRKGEAHELVCAALARQGKMSLQDTHECIGFPPPNTPAEQAYLSYMVTHPYWYEAETSQSRNYFFSDTGEPSLDSKEERAARRPFGDMPLIVLTASEFSANPWEDQAAVEARKADWRAGHDALAARSTRGRSIVVQGAGHFIQLDQPDVVIGSIKEVVAEVRRASR